MPFFSAPSNVEETKLENLEREVGCSEEDIMLAKRHGMIAWHLEGLRLYCWEFNRLLILRSSKFESRKFHFSGEHTAKPVDVKDKTNNGEVISRSKIEPRYTRFFSDYDILSLWQYSGFSYTRMKTCLPERDFEPNRFLLDGLNTYIGNRVMFKHGANDEFVDSKGFPKNPIGCDETFIAFNQRRQIIELGNIAELRQFYQSSGLEPWVY